MAATSTKIETSHVERVQQIVKASKEYSEIRAGAGGLGTGMDALLSAVTGMTTATATAAETTSRRPVVIHVEGNMLRGFIEGYDKKSDEDMKWSV